MPKGKSKGKKKGSYPCDCSKCQGRPRSLKTIKRHKERGSFLSVLYFFSFFKKILFN